MFHKTKDWLNRSKNVNKVLWNLKISLWVYILFVKAFFGVLICRGEGKGMSDGAYGINRK